MARERESRGRGGQYLLIALLFVLLVAWYSGALERALYVFQGRSGALMTQQAVTLSNEQSGNYVYARLSEEDQQKYLILLDAFQSREERAFPEATIEELQDMRDCVMADHPELFDVSGALMNTVTTRGTGLVTSVTVEGQYAFSLEDAQAMREQLDVAADQLLADVPISDDDYTKVRYVYEQLAQHVSYDHEAAEAEEATLAGQTAVDALVEGRAVCAGYARAFQYLMYRLDIPCVYVSGTARGEGHAWCAVQLSGSWYFIDPTWGDPQYRDEEGAGDYNRVNYDYFCVTSDDIQSTHTTSCPYPLPECTATACNYYVHEGLYLDTGDVGRAGNIVRGFVERGEDPARFRCATRDIYDKMVLTLFAAHEIAHYIPSNSCSYLLNDNMLTIEVNY